VLVDPLLGEGLAEVGEDDAGGVSDGSGADEWLAELDADGDGCVVADVDTPADGIVDGELTPLCAEVRLTGAFDDRADGVADTVGSGWGYEPGARAYGTSTACCGILSAVRPPNAA